MPAWLLRAPRASLALALSVVWSPPGLEHSRPGLTTPTGLILDGGDVGSEALFL